MVIFRRGDGFRARSSDAAQPRRDRFEQILSEWLTGGRSPDSACRIRPRSPPAAPTPRRHFRPDMIAGKIALRFFQDENARLLRIRWHHAGLHHGLRKGRDIIGDSFGSATVSRCGSDADQSLAIKWRINPWTNDGGS